MCGCTTSISSSSHLHYLCTSQCDHCPKFWSTQLEDFFYIRCFGYGWDTGDDGVSGRFFWSWQQWERRGGVGGIDAKIFCKNQRDFWDFLELVELSVLCCFTPWLLNDPLVTASSWSTPPHSGSCLWPGVPLDHLMGWCSLLAIFTHLVSCWRQDGGGAVHSILKLWDHFDQNNEKWRKNGIKRGTRGKWEKMHCDAFLILLRCKSLVSEKSNVYFFAQWNS